MSGHESSFIWDSEKEFLNIQKHGVDFQTAAKAFKDPNRKIYTDSKHSQEEERFFCIGKLEGQVVTVRVLYREGKIRIIVAGLGRKGEKYYDQKDNQID